MEIEGFFSVDSWRIWPPSKQIKRYQNSTVNKCVCTRAYCHSFSPLSPLFSFPSSPLFSILELYQHNNARKIEAIVMMFISILLFFLPPPLYYFFFPFYRPITHTVHVYNSNTDGIFQENNTKKKERKKKNQITIIEAQTSRKIKNFTIHRIIDGKILTIRSQTISSNTGNVSKQLHGYPSIFPQIHRPLSAAITMTMQSYRSK